MQLYSVPFYLQYFFLCVLAVNSLFQAAYSIMHKSVYFYISDFDYGIPHFHAEVL